MQSSSRTIDEALRGVAGVQLPLDNTPTIFPLQPSIAIRGMGVGDTATRALVLVDGLPINGRSSATFSGTAPRSRRSIGWRLCGVPRRALFGSYAIGGVVNVVTRPSGPQEAILDAQYGEQNTFQGNLWYGQVVGESATLGLNGNYYNTDGYFAFPSDQIEPVNQKTSGQLYNLQARGDFRISAETNGFFRVGYNNQHWNGP
jgi:outer membrane cobalamin receptor